MVVVVVLVVVVVVGATAAVVVVLVLVSSCQRGVARLQTHTHAQFVFILSAGPGELEEQWWPGSDAPTSSRCRVASFCARCFVRTGPAFVSLWYGTIGMQSCEVLHKP